MSYARFGWDGSDVYVFLSVDGALECCGCQMSPPREGSLFGPSRQFHSTVDMLAHLDEHRAAGHTVTDDTYAELRAEADENDLLIGADRA